MEHTYQYSWIIPFIPLPVPILLGAGLLLFPTATKNLRRMWTFLSIFLLSIVMIFSLYLSIQQIFLSCIHQNVWSWTINNEFSFEFGYFIDPLTSIMSILITTVGILVLIYSDNYMSHDQGYLRFFAYMGFFNTSMLGLVTSSNLIQVYFFLGISWNVFVFINRFLVHTTYCSECLSKSFCNQSCRGFWFIIRNFRSLLDSWQFRISRFVRNIQ
ncbi:unnamed protein product [Brassica rapa subsp. narinosa]